MGDKKLENKVIVYSTPTCPYCNIAKTYLKERGIEFKDHDVSKNREKAIEMMKKTGRRGVPVLDINGVVLVGFDKKKVEAALAGVKIDKEAARQNLVFDPFDQ